MYILFLCSFNEYKLKLSSISNNVMADCCFALKAWNAQNGGAAAILIADDRIEPLNTLGSDEEDDPDSEYVHDILIPLALISKSFGDTIKKAISCGETVKMGLNWAEALPHPDNSITYEFWANSNGKYGPKFVVEKNCLKVNSLSSLGGVYECAIGNVGVPHYGGTMFGTVVYPEANQKACNSFADLDIFFKSRPGRLPVILLADRGGQLLLKKCFIIDHALQNFNFYFNFIIDYPFNYKF